MAEAFFRELAGDSFRAESAGTIPAEHPHPEVVAAMAERGIPVEDRPGSLLTQERANEASRVIGMGCAVEEACPALRVPLEDWELEDPKEKSPDQVARIRDEIERRVRALITELSSS
jgi:arsenate reductase (thioredoxin)